MRIQRLCRLRQSVNTPNKEEDIKASVEALKKILNDELPYYPILYKTYSAVVSNELTGEILLLCSVITMLIAANGTAVIKSQIQKSKNYCKKSRRMI